MNYKNRRKNRIKGIKLIADFIGHKWETVEYINQPWFDEIKSWTTEYYYAPADSSMHLSSDYGWTHVTKYHYDEQRLNLKMRNVLIGKEHELFVKLPLEDALFDKDWNWLTIVIAAIYESPIEINEGIAIDFSDVEKTYHNAVKFIKSTQHEWR